MDLPKYQELFLPVLQFYLDQKGHSLQETVKAISEKMNLSADQKALRLSSGQRVIHNRVSWAQTYLRHAGLIESVSRGVSRITPRGVEVLSTKPPFLDNKYLSKFPEFVEFKNKKRDDIDSPAETQDTESESKTPEERIAYALKEHNDSLADELLGILREVDPNYFEKIVGDLLNVMGYGSVEVTQRTNDGGIDAIVNEDALGLSKIYVQAKRYGSTNRVNGKEIRDFVGALQMNGVNKGVFITTSFFYEKALDDLRSTSQSIILVDGLKRAEIMIEFDLGVSTEKAFKIKRVDTDYLSER